MLGKSHAIAFDIGNTLIDVKTIQRVALEAVAKILHECDAIDDVDAFLKAYMEVDSKAEGPGVNQLFSKPFDIMGDTFRNLGIKNRTLLYYALSVYREEVSNCIRPNPTISRLLKNLSSKYKLAIISDGSLDDQIYTLHRMNIISLFDSIIISEVIGRTKPDPAIFDALVEELDIPIRNIVIVGDHLDKDIRGGKDYGLKTIWVKKAPCSNYKNYEKYIDKIIDYNQIGSIENLLSTTFAKQ